MINVCVIEDDPLAADLLQDYIRSDEMRMVAHYDNAEDALSRIPTLPLPDVVLMDIGLPGYARSSGTYLLILLRLAADGGYKPSLPGQLGGLNRT